MTQISGELVAVQTLEPGDEVLVIDGFHVVSKLEPSSRGGYVVIYFRNREDTWESRARDKSGWRVEHRIVERQLVQMDAGVLVTARRGRPETAERIRGEMTGALERRRERAEARR